MQPRALGSRRSLRWPQTLSLRPHCQRSAAPAILDLDSCNSPRAPSFCSDLSPRPWMLAACAARQHQVYEVSKHILTRESVPWADCQIFEFERPARTQYVSLVIRPLSPHATCAALKPKPWLGASVPLPGRTL